MLFGKKVWILLIISMILLSACGAGTPTADQVSVMMTEGVGTMVAAFFQTSTAMVTPATNTAPATQTPLPLNTPTPFSTFTPFATATSTFFYFTPTLLRTPTPTGTFYTSTPNQAALAYGCNNLGFIRDVNIPPGTLLQSSQDFIKTWKVQNTGTCDWMYQYALLPVGEDFGGGPARLERRVIPWNWTEISVNVTAPRSPGTYSSYWRLADADGHMFGDTLVISIRVAAPATDTPVPTSTETPTPTYTPTP